MEPGERTRVQRSNESRVVEVRSSESRATGWTLSDFLELSRTVSTVSLPSPAFLDVPDFPSQDSGRFSSKKQPSGASRDYGT